MAALPVRLRRPRVGDAGWMLHRQAALYHEEFSYHPVFEGYVARSFASFFEHYDKRRDRIWVAARGQDVLGFIAVQHDHERRGWAKLRWFLVEPKARGQGLGRRLMGVALRFCRNVGFVGVSLWTVDDLVAAGRIYQANGFRVVEQTSCPWAPWARQQRWELKMPRRRAPAIRPGRRRQREGA